jgi:hypothetical protein
MPVASLGALPEVCAARLVEGDTFAALNSGLDRAGDTQTIRGKLVQLSLGANQVLRTVGVLENLEIIGTGKAKGAL